MRFDVFGVEEEEVARLKEEAEAREKEMREQSEALDQVLAQYYIITVPSR